MCNLCEGNHRALSYTEDSSFLSEKRGPAAEADLLVVPMWLYCLRANSTWRRDSLTLQGRSVFFGWGFSKKSGSRWIDFLCIKACSWVAGYLISPCRNYLFRKNAKPPQSLLSSRTKFTGGGQEEVFFFSSQSLCVGKAIRCSLFLAL